MIVPLGNWLHSSTKREKKELCSGLLEGVDCRLISPGFCTKCFLSCHSFMCPGLYQVTDGLKKATDEWKYFIFALHFESASDIKGRDRRAGPETRLSILRIFSPSLLNDSN